eukprot:6339226-Alexandrium_andersonii.AAC.1
MWTDDTTTRRGKETMLDVARAVADVPPERRLGAVCAEVRRPASVPATFNWMKMTPRAVDELTWRNQ